MTEQEMIEKIKESAQETKIPDRLMPEAVKINLRKENRSKMLRHQRNKMVAAAAAVVLVSGAGISALYFNQGISQAEGRNGASGFSGAEEAEIMGSAAENAAEDNNSQLKNKKNEIQHSSAVKEDAGDLYTVADNYGDVYDSLQNSKVLNMELSSEESMKLENGTADSFTKDTSSYMGSQKEQEYTDTASSYNKTNLQTEGVDESDIIKTDGSYIYTVQSNKVSITSVQNEKMKSAGEITITASNGTDQIKELYVDGTYLILLVEKEDTGLRKREEKSSDTMSDLEDVYYINTNSRTEVQTYDIKDPSNPALLGTTIQDGNYKTSRKIGDVVYLFTDINAVVPQLTREESCKTENTSGWIPLINGTPVSADCIYIPEQGNRELVISSTNVKEPEQIVDNTVIVNNYVDIYVSSEAFYLYSTVYRTGNSETQIAKFGMDKGQIRAIGAISADGEIKDTFAIHESEGKLRLLTTSWNQPQTENTLYVFDEKLNLTGKLEHIAAGEEIYAARYLDDMVYFVTYRNTDPLFAVDLSDDKNPKVLGELKINGFSEYLHFWGEDKLVGIGRETDPDSGEWQGIKLTMFDISDPANLKQIDSYIIKNANDSPAFYFYKCVLADAKENLLGFAVENYSNADKNSYLLFSWKDESFQEQLVESVDVDQGNEQYRGIYIGDTFYLANPKNICSYNRKDGYAFIEKFDL